jgi:hypothetical protein
MVHGYGTLSFTAMARYFTGENDGIKKETHFGFKRNVFLAVP